MIREIKAIVREDRVPDILHALHHIEGLPGATLSIVRGFGRRIAGTDAPTEYGETEMAKIELVVPDALVRTVTDAIARAARTGRPGDGKIFVIPVDNAINIRSGSQGADAL